MSEGNDTPLFMQLSRFYVLAKDGGLLIGRDNEGKEFMSIWSRHADAEDFAQRNFPDYEVIDLDLERMLLLVEDQRKMGLAYVISNHKGKSTSLEVSQYLAEWSLLPAAAVAASDREHKAARSGSGCALAIAATVVITSLVLAGVAIGAQF